MKLTVEPVSIEGSGQHRSFWWLVLIALAIGTVYLCQQRAIAHFWQTQVIPQERIDHRINSVKQVNNTNQYRFDLDRYALPYSEAQFRDGLKRTRQYDRYLVGLLMIKNGPSLSIDAPTNQAEYSDVSTMLGLGAVEVSRSAPGTSNYVLSSRTMDNDRLLFSPLSNVVVGQQITVAAEGDREWQYRVVEKRLISQGDTSWKESTGQTPTLTLLTANGSQSNRMRRLVVTAQVIGSE